MSDLLPRISRLLRTTYLGETREVLADSRAEISRLQAVIADLRDARDGRSVYEMRLEDQVKDLQAVVDAAREESGRHLPFRYVGGGTAPCDCGLCDAIRTYDGEVKP